MFGYLDILDVWMFDISIFPRYLNQFERFDRSERSSLVLILIGGLQSPALT